MMNIQLTAQANGLVARASALRLAHSVTDLGVFGTAVS
jgi:hypothetical protein